LRSFDAAQGFKAAISGTAMRNDYQGVIAMGAGMVRGRRRLKARRAGRDARGNRPFLLAVGWSGTAGFFPIRMHYLCMLPTAVQGKSVFWDWLLLRLLWTAGAESFEKNREISGYCLDNLRVWVLFCEQGRVGNKA
jgi:hypothetical protein